jgi:nitrogen fixation NifU-like protein
MEDDLERFVRNLQAQILEEARLAYGDLVLERWQNPLYKGSMDNPDGYACVTGRCHDTMEIFLKFRDEKVLEASFRTNGCSSSMVCGSFAAEMAHGKGPDELLEVTGEAILKRLGGLPEEEAHCAFLAAETLQEALNDYMIRQAGGRRDKEKYR